jgi:hypothetical protein
MSTDEPTRLRGGGFAWYEGELSPPAQLDREFRNLRERREALERTPNDEQLHAALRISEALALRWADLDFEANLVHVPGTKTEGSRADVPMIPALRTELLAHRKRQPGVGDVLVFRTATGKPQERHNAARAIRLAGTRAKVGRQKPLSPHDLRHSCAALLLEAGVPDPQVAAIMRPRRPEGDAHGLCRDHEQAASCAAPRPGSGVSVSRTEVYRSGPHERGQAVRAKARRAGGRRRDSAGHGCVADPLLGRSEHREPPPALHLVRDRLLPRRGRHSLCASVVGASLRPLIRWQPRWQPRAEPPVHAGALAAARLRLRSGPTPQACTRGHHFRLSHARGRWFDPSRAHSFGHRANRRRDEPVGPPGC